MQMVWRVTPSCVKRYRGRKGQNRRAELVLIGLEKYVDDVGSCPDVMSDPVQR
jgi:hypothetical protein